MWPHPWALEYKWFVTAQFTRLVDITQLQHTPTKISKNGRVCCGCLAILIQVTVTSPSHLSTFHLTSCHGRLTRVLRSCTARWGWAKLGVDASGSVALGVSAPVVAVSPPVAIYPTQRTPHACRRNTCSREMSNLWLVTTPYQPINHNNYFSSRAYCTCVCVMASEATLKQCYNKGCGSGLMPNFSHFYIPVLRRSKPHYQY